MITIRSLFTEKNNMSYISTERMHEYGFLLEERIRMEIREAALAREAQNDYAVRMAVEQAWRPDTTEEENMAIRRDFLRRLDDRVTARMTEKEALQADMQLNRRARRRWHKEVNEHIHAIVCPHCNPSTSCSDLPNGGAVRLRIVTTTEEEEDTAAMATESEDYETEMAVALEAEFPSL